MKSIKFLIPLFSILVALTPFIGDPEPINSEAIIKKMLSKLERRFKEIEKAKSISKQTLVDKTIKEFFSDESVDVDKFYAEKEKGSRILPLRNMLMACGTEYKIIQLSYVSRVQFCKDKLTNPFAVVTIDIEFATENLSSSTSSGKIRPKYVQVFFSEEDKKIVARLGKISQNHIECPQPLFAIKDSDVKPVPIPDKPTEPVKPTEPTKTTDKPSAPIADAGKSKPKPDKSKTPTVLINPPLPPAPATMTVTKPCPVCPVVNCKESTVYVQDMQACKEASDNWQYRFDTLTVADNNVRSKLEEAEKKIKQLEEDNTRLNGLLKAIREQIVATVEAAQHQKSVFIQAASDLKKEYEAFADAEKLLTPNKANPIYNATKIIQLENLKATHKTRAVDMWRTLSSVAKFSDTAYVLLKDVYTLSLPNAQIPAYAYASKNGFLNALPTPEQLLKKMQEIVSPNDDSNQLQFDILDDHPGAILATMKLSEYEAGNQAASLSLYFMSELLRSKSPTTIAHVNKKIEDGFLEELMLRVFPSQGNSEVIKANNYYKDKNYLDALRIYMDYERTINELKDDALKTEANYNYATILLWNLGDFSQKKGLFKGKMKTKMRQRVGYASSILRNIATFDNGEAEDDKNKNAKEENTNTNTKKKTEAEKEAEKKIRIKKKELGKKANISLAKYGTS
jgi:hypothetical protein